MQKILKLLGAVIFICIIIVSLVLLWGGRDLPAQDVSDLMPEQISVPNDQNAFQHLVAAADKIELPPDLNMIIEYIEGKHIYASLMPEILEKNAACIPLIQDALAFTQCQAPGSTDPSYVSKYYRIAILLALQASYDGQTNRINQSVQSTIALLRLSDLIHPHAQNLATFGAAVRIMQLGLNQAGTIARMENVSVEVLGQLAEALAVLRPLNHGLKRAFQYKFQEVSNQIDSFRSSHKSLEQTFSDTALLPYILRKTTWFPGYLFKENETKQKLAALYRDTIQNTSLHYAEMNIYDLEQYLGLTGSKLFFLYKPNFVGRLFYAFTTPEIDTYLEGKCQMEGSIQATRLIVALQRYRHKNGQLPAQLASLCPEYLSNVPLDPFDGQPFRYSASKAIVYSVGKDLKDSNGSTEIPPGEIYGEEYPKTWIAMDGVFNLNR